MYPVLMIRQLRSLFEDKRGLWSRQLSGGPFKDFRDTGYKGKNQRDAGYFGKTFVGYGIFGAVNPGYEV